LKLTEIEIVGLWIIEAQAMENSEKRQGKVFEDLVSTIEDEQLRQILKAYIIVFEYPKGLPSRKIVQNTRREGGLNCILGILKTFRNRRSLYLTNFSFFFKRLCLMMNIRRNFKFDKCTSNMFFKTCFSQKISLD